MTIELNSPLGVDVAYQADARLSLVSGPALVAQDVAARWELPPGGNPVNPDDGSVYLAQWINRPYSGATDPKLSTIQALCVSEAKRDDRVLDITVNVTLERINATSSRLRIEADGTTAQGPFRLVGNVADDGFTFDILTNEEA